MSPSLRSDRLYSLRKNVRSVSEYRFTGCGKSRLSYQGIASQATERVGFRSIASQAAEKLTNVRTTVEERPFRAA